MLASRQARVFPHLARGSALGAALVAVVIAAAVAGPRAVGARAADLHLINVASAERVTRSPARGYASRAAAVFSESRDFRTHTEAAVDCRRVADHRAACSWRAFVYLVGHMPSLESLWIVCLGRAEVRLAKGRLRVDLRGAGCAH